MAVLPPSHPADFSSALDLHSAPIFRLDHVRHHRNRLIRRFGQVRAHGASLPSLQAYHPDGVSENKHAFLTFKAHIGSLSEDAHAKVNKNLAAVKGMAYFR